MTAPDGRDAPVFQPYDRAELRAKRQAEHDRSTYSTGFREGYAAAMGSDSALAESNRQVAAKALRDAAADMRTCKDVGHWNLRDPHDLETSYSPDMWLAIRADRIAGGQ